ncbi:hypothetical protein D6833_00380 [Candidatus Parcubacteria bacterium]|nr:MAG: hypothetical protein D6833_00380 [Candidatus Parcubacteria bacterium]
MLANWVKQTTSTTGTALTLALDGTPPAGFIAFSDAFVDQESVCYSITDGNNREIGVGYLTAGTPWTLTREKVWEKLENGVYAREPATPLALSGTAEVSIDATAQWAGQQPWWRESTKTTRAVGPDYVLKTQQTNGSVDGPGANRLFLVPFITRGWIKATSGELRIGGSSNLTARVALGIYSWPVDDTARLLTTTGQQVVPQAAVANLPFSPLIYLRPNTWYLLGLATVEAVGLPSLQPEELVQGMTRPGAPWWLAGKMFLSLAANWTALPSTVAVSTLSTDPAGPAPFFVVRSV